jgi:hypothetical protein
MRRTVVRLAAVTSLTLAAAVGVAGPALAVAPPPDKTAGKHDCRFPVVCHPGLHLGDGNGRNVGG